MKNGHEMKANKIYSRLLNETIRFSNSNITTFYKYVQNGEYKSIKCTKNIKDEDTFNLYVSKSNLLDKYPFLLIKNNLIIIDYFPDLEEWLGIFGMTARVLYPNIKNVHVVRSGIIYRRSTDSKNLSYIDMKNKSLNDYKEAVSIVNDENPTHRKPNVIFHKPYEVLKFDSSSSIDKNTITIGTINPDGILAYKIRNCFSIEFKSYKKENK